MTGKKSVGRMFDYAVFDIKPIYKIAKFSSHTYVQLHTTKISFGGRAVEARPGGRGLPLALLPPLIEPILVEI